ncbi:DUF1566 domain-containing protein [Desulfobacterota bacterium AH_259_B03_O07]|nr:DUF1566 domain-containing protein [Desulfobacterota bacterium AH_259_B03_O07]
MKKVFLSFIASLFILIVAVVLWAGTAYAPPPFPVPPTGGFPACQSALNTCNDGLGTCNTNLGDRTTELDICDGELNTCNDDLVACQAQPSSDATVTTGLIWEKKDSPGGGVSVCPGGPTCDNPHDVDNRYVWTTTGVAPDGPVFTDFLDKLNNGCDNDPTVDCSAGGDADCINAGVFGACGFAGHRDWRLPEVAIASTGGLGEFDGVLDCSIGSSCIDPIFGPAATSGYWSASTFAGNPFSAWDVGFDNGGVLVGSKDGSSHVRAVRDGP